MSQQYPKWAIPLGIRITDWIAVIAFILSVAGFLWTAFARQLYPSTDISFPEQIQIQCAPYDQKKKECPSNSGIKLIADLFSIWNDSIISTKPQILQRIDATVDADSFGRLPMRWQYFTEVVDRANKQKGNAGRTIFYFGDLRNIEIEFYPVQMVDDGTFTWFSLLNAIADKNIVAEFYLDFAYGSDLDALCHLSFRSEDLSRLRNSNFSSPYIVADATCRAIEAAVGRTDLPKIRGKLPRH